MNRMMTLGYIMVQGAVMLASLPAWGDIYRYVDESGTVHFSNVPTSGKFEVYIRETIPTWIDRSSQFDLHIAEAAKIYNVPFHLIKAVIKAESDFDPSAVSTAGACGLMQLMPGTAKALGIENPFDPKANVMGGVRYLKEMLTRFNGSIPLAVAAYNAGPGRIGPRREIPGIKETKGYVRKVLDYMNRY